MVVVVLAVLGLAGCDLTGTEGGTTGVEVTVLVDDDPTAGAVVTLFASGGSAPLHQDTTGADGVAQLLEVDPGQYDVAVAVPDSVPLAGGQPDRVPISIFRGQRVTLAYQLTRETEDNIQIIHLTAANEFSPASVTIDTGTAVRWINDEAVFHTVTPDGHTEWQRAELRQAGEAFTHTFDTAGEFPYFSEPFANEGMTGTVIVEEPAG